MKTNPPSMLPAALAALLLTACGGGSGSHNAFLPIATGTPPPPASAAPLACDDTLKANFKPDALTTVVAVKAFKKGDALILGGTATGATPLAANDVCMVKLNVGPGNPGPADAPSTSPGIGIEVWLPAKAAWNSRVHALGGGGWRSRSTASC
ncbi:hypothetical protein ACEN8K_23235 [Variovorax sp. CT11-76]